MMTDAILKACYYTLYVFGALLLVRFLVEVAGL